MAQDDVPIAHVVLEAPELQEFIGTLAAARATLADKHAIALDPGTRLETQVDPSWRINTLADGSKALAIRHPGFGWLAFQLPKHEASAIAKLLEN